MSSRQPDAANAPRGVPEATAPSLVVGGVLILLAVFLMANRWFGVAERMWPWEMMARGTTDPLVRAVFYLWIIAALTAIILGLTRMHRMRAVLLGAMTAVLLVECTGRGAGFVIDVYNLNQILPMIGLGAGFLIARQANTRGLGRLLAGMCGIVLLWVLASTFIEDGEIVQLAAFWRDVQLVAADWNHEFASPNFVWWTLVPRGLVIVAAAAGVLAMLGLAHRHFLLGAFGVLLLGMIFPFFVGTILLRERGAGMNLLLQQLAQTFIAQGFLLWYVSVFVVFDLARGRMRAA